LQACPVKEQGALKMHCLLPVKSHKISFPKLGSLSRPRQGICFPSLLQIFPFLPPTGKEKLTNAPTNWKRLCLGIGAFVAFGATKSITR